METTAQGGGMFFWFILLAFAFIVIFLPARSQKKREQELMSKVNALQKGDQIIIPGGIIGTVAGFKDNALEVKVAENVKLTVLKTAGEGGPYGMAVLAAYMRSREPGQTLEAYLRSRVFSDDCGVSVEATVEEAEGYRQFLRQYRRLLPVEGNAAALLNGRT